MPTNLFGDEQDAPKERKREIFPKTPMFPLVGGGMSKLEKAFWLFHNNNPQVYRLLVKFTGEWWQARGDEATLGMKALFERVRWQTSIETKDEHDLKLNNNHTAFYARLIMANNPELKGIFRLRRQRIQATIGPKKADLPDGGQIH